MLGILHHRWAQQDHSIAVAVFLALLTSFGTLSLLDFGRGLATTEMFQGLAIPLSFTFAICARKPVPRWHRAGAQAKLCKLQLRASSSCLEWLEVLDGPDHYPVAEATILPVFPLNAIKFPGSEVHLNIMQPAYRQMYDDLLSSGARRFLVPFSPCVRNRPRGRVRFSEMPPADRRLYAVCAVLFVEDLRELSAETGDQVKYQVRHTVLGRARMKRLLNPSVLFKTSRGGDWVDYLRAEVEVLDESPDSALDKASAHALAHVWEELRQLSKQAAEPQLPDQGILELYTTWQLAELWQTMQLSLQVHRENKRVLREIQEWITSQQEEGHLPDTVGQPLDFSKIGLPASLLEALTWSRTSKGLVLNDEFWEPLLRLQAARDVEDRGGLLVELVRNEVRLMHARASLRDTLGQHTK